MKSILVIDDMRVFDEQDDEFIVTVRNLRDANSLFSQRAWDEVWLDHDLGGDDTIRPFVSAIEELAHQGQIFNVGMFVIISDNPVGRDWMIAALKSYYPIEVGKREYRIEEA